MNRHTDIDDVIINREESTVYLAKPGMNLDVGAVAKGYAVEKPRRRQSGGDTTRR